MSPLDGWCYQGTPVLSPEHFPPRLGLRYTDAAVTVSSRSHIRRKRIGQATARRPFNLTEFGSAERSRLAGQLGRACGLKISYYNSLVEIHSSARKHGVGDGDIEHAIENAISVDDQDDDTRLYLGPARDAELLEVVTITREDGSELVIHAMKMRPKYRRLLPGD